MSSDTQFAEGLDGAEIDPLYAGFDDTPPADRKQQEDALPRGIYVLEFQAGKGGFGKDPDPILGRPMPSIRLGAKVIEGVEGTAGRVGFGRLAIYPYGTVYEKVDDGQGGTKQETRKATPAEYEKALQEHKEVLRRIGEVLGLVYGLPARPITEATLTEWGKQFAGKRAVLDISYMPASGEYDSSNFFRWSSIATLDEPVVNKKGEVEGTALEVAQKKIEKANARAAAKASAKRSAAATGVGGF